MCSSRPDASIADRCGWCRPGNSQSSAGRERSAVQMSTTQLAAAARSTIPISAPGAQTPNVVCSKYSSPLPTHTCGVAVASAATSTFVQSRVRSSQSPVSMRLQIQKVIHETSFSQRERTPSSRIRKRAPASPYQSDDTCCTGQRRGV